jgi:hypothetical protein
MSRYILTIVERPDARGVCIPMQYLLASKEAAVEKAQSWVKVMIDLVYEKRNVAIKIFKTQEELDKMIQDDPIGTWETLRVKVGFYHHLFLLPVPETEAPETFEDFGKVLDASFESKYKAQFPTVA